MITQADIDKFEHVIPADLAAQVRTWFAARQGMLIWPAVDLSIAGSVAVTPAVKEDGTPITAGAGWAYAKTPSKRITDPAQVGVVTVQEVERFKVTLVSTRTGLNLSDKSNDQLNAALRKAGPFSTYDFDYGTQEVIVKEAVSIVPLPEYVG